MSTRSTALDHNTFQSAKILSSSVFFSAARRHGCFVESATRSYLSFSTLLHLAQGNAAFTVASLIEGYGRMTPAILLLKRLPRPTPPHTIKLVLYSMRLSIDNILLSRCSLSQSGRRSGRIGRRGKYIPKSKRALWSPHFCCSTFRIPAEEVV